MTKGHKRGLGSELERTFQTYWNMFASGAPQPVREYRFHPVRRWRFDFAWPDHQVAVELQGGTWSKGRHVRGHGYENDCEKLAEAQLNGWVVLYVTRGMLERNPPQIVQWVLQAIGAKDG